MPTPTEQAQTDRKSRQARGRSLLIPPSKSRVAFCVWPICPAIRFDRGLAGMMQSCDAGWPDSCSYGHCPGRGTFGRVSSTGRRNTLRSSAPTVGAGAISPLRAKTLDTGLGSDDIRQYWQHFQPCRRVAFSFGMNRVRACPSICMPFQRGGLE